MRARLIVSLAGVAIIVLAGLLVIIVGLSRYLAPLPAPEFQAGTLPTQISGTAPTLPWPARASAAVMVDGLGVLGSNADDRPRPLASVVKIMTALLILEEHPLRPGERGPILTLTAADVVAYNAAVADDQSALRVLDGERITQYQLLEGIMIPSANNFADILARWDAGSVAAFVEKMNTRAKALGMTQTRYVDPSGNDPAGVGTARDQLLLAEAAMRNDVFAEIIAKPQTDLPVVGTVYNVNAIIGSQGNVGIKTGSGPEAGGCFVFAARVTSAGQPAVVIGAVLGTTFLSDAFKAAQDLTRAAAGIPRQVQALPPGQHVGEVVTAWGTSAPVLTTAPVTVLGWDGLPMRTGLEVTPPAAGTPAGTQVGTLKVEIGASSQAVPVVTSQAVDGPGWWWRLRR